MTQPQSHRPNVFGYILPSEEEMQEAGRAMNSAMQALARAFSRPAERIRAYHPASGSVLYGEVTAETGKAPRRSFRLIPDGLGEEVILREGVWHVTAVEKR